jgi:hypothetical protein
VIFEISEASNVDLIGYKSTKKGAKLTILNMKVRIRKFKCHQKIPWVRFAGNDISNYGLIFNKNGARDQNIISIHSSPIFCLNLRKKGRKTHAKPIPFTSLPHFLFEILIFGVIMK